MHALRAVAHVRLNHTPARVLQGNCSMEQSGDAGLQQLLVDLVGELLPLKPFQCLLVTDASTFYIRNANGLWFDNIYVGFTEPRRRREFGAFLSAGDRAFLNVNGYSKPINIFMTNMTVHGHGNIKHISQVLSMTPNEQQVSLLIQGTAHDWGSIAVTEVPVLFKALVNAAL